MESPLQESTTHHHMKESELRETIRAAFARYDEDASGAIDARELRRLVEDLGGMLTDSDLSAALRVLDKDCNGTIDLQEFIGWWTSQKADLDGDGAVNDLEKTLERLKEFGRERFHVNIHIAAWRGFGDVVERLVQDDRELATERDASDYGVRTMAASWGKGVSVTHSMHDILYAHRT